MLDDTEIKLAYEVANTNLICIKPQYTKKEWDNKIFTSYKGKVYISSNFISEDLNELVELINIGINE
mgnify:FL=1